MNNLIKPSQIECALAAVETPEEGNFLRRQIAAVRELLGHRQQSFLTLHEAGRLYVEACAKAGYAWAQVRPGSGKPTNVSLLLRDAGFKNEMDATRCVRIAELDAEDLRTYYEECMQDGREPTLGGAYAIWRMLNEDGEERERHACPACGAVHVVK